MNTDKEDSENLGKASSPDDSNPEEPVSVDSASKMHPVNSMIDRCLARCSGTINSDGVCDICGERNDRNAAAGAAIFQSVRDLLKHSSSEPSKEELLWAASQLRNVAPYNFEAWRLHADVLLNALRQLETRTFMPDAAVTLLSAPLREEDLRDAAEAALRQCARYADSDEKMIAIVDEANRVRRLSWF